MTPVTAAEFPAADPADRPPTMTLPAGHRDALGRVRPGSDGGSLGEYGFGGHLVRIHTTGDQVLHPTDVGLSLLAALDRDRAIAVVGARVLDVGCGSGLYTVALLRAGATSVTALDVNAACVSATLTNVTGNGLDVSRVQPLSVALADLAIDNPWDVVVCNPPHFPHDPTYAARDGLEAALVGGDDGRALYDVLLARLDELLTPGGTLLLAHSSLTDIGRTCRELVEAGYRCRTVQVCELDMPLRRYAAHRDVLLARLYQLRAAGRAAFHGLRFEVHTLAITRPQPA